MYLIEQVIVSITFGAARFRGCRGIGRGRVLLFLAASLSLGGCSTKSFTDPIIGPGYTAGNVFRKNAALPATLRRVAVLPLSYNENNASGAAGRETLEPVFHAELTKTGRFELLFVKPAQLQQWSGKGRWDDLEELPADFLKTLAQRSGCDGVLFARLTQFQAYPPMVLGWRMRLVANDADILWTVDELFDAAEQTVSNSARRYDHAHTRNNPVLEDSRSILLSPSKFGQYTLFTVLGTLPIR